MTSIKYHRATPIWTALSLLLLFMPVNILLADTGGKIVGKIVDVETGEPLVGVNVEIIGTTMGAATDVDGDFYILNIPPGIYNLRGSMMGYQTVTMTGVEVSVNHTTRSDFRLKGVVIELGEVVQVVAERPLVEKDETSTRHFVDAAEIASRPTSELTQILTTLPSIDVAEGGELVVRRGTLDQVSFLIDGMRARNPLDFEPYTNINLTAIQDLEIITGGFNAEYGEAQSGVFNIVTKEGNTKYEGYAEMRWTPPGKPHWGTAFYDYSTNKYWENSHARHLQWWIDHPDQWVDPGGVAGNDPNCSQTPEEAYAAYIKNHQPLNDYTNESGYQYELAFGGPLFLDNLFFFVSGKYRTIPPVTGNTFRSHGTWYDGTAKVTYHIGNNIKLVLSGFYGLANSIQGMEYMDVDWVTGHGLENKYAYYDFPGYPENNTNGQTLQFTHSLNVSTFYQIQFSRIYRLRSQSTFPGDANGWDEGIPAYDGLRAVDENGNPITGGFSNLIGLHTTGYYYRGKDKNTDWSLSGDLVSQVNKFFQIKAGGDFTYYVLNRYQEAKAFFAIEKEIYHPYEGNIYGQSKLEFQSLIMNLGLRYDFYNPNDNIYLDPYDPFDVYGSIIENRTPKPNTKPTSLSGQLSPRIGISHPISEKTVLHFSYGHFFQRASFGDYGEGYDVSGILNTYLIDPASGTLVPYNLGNRQLKPRKTVAYEIGIEHNLGDIVLDVTPFYKDYTNTIRKITVYTLSGGRYLTSGNSNYADAKGVEISIRKPLAGYWGAYLNYTWSTGIAGRSGDPDVMAAPGSNTQVGVIYDIGDAIQYDPPRLKFGITLATPRTFSSASWLLGDIQLSLDYSIYYSHPRIASHVFSEAGKQYERPADKNAMIRFRKEFNVYNLKPAIFIEIHNAFNNIYTNVDVVKSASPEDRVKFINSGLTEYPQYSKDGGPFPDVIKYRNLPRRIYLGVSLGF